MARPLELTLNAAQREELRRYTSDEELVMQDATGAMPMRTSEPGQLHCLIEAEPIVLAHCQSQTPPGYQTHQGPSPLVSLEPDKALREMRTAWNLIDSAIGGFRAHTEPDTPTKRLSPRLEAFYQAYEPVISNYGYSLFNPEQVIDRDICQDIDKLLTEGFTQFQEAIRSSDMKRAIKHHQVNHHRNQQSLQRYLETLLSAYPSLYVLHLDLGYSVRSRQTILRATYTRLREDLKTLFYARHANPMWKDDLVGHIWKIEDGPERRFHVHLLLFYDGATADQHQEDADRLKQRWIHDITHQEGALYARRNDQTPVLVPENTGHLITRDDPKAIKQLKDYLTFLTRVSQILGLETHRQAHVFSKGHAPRKKASGQQG